MREYINDLKMSISDSGTQVQNAIYGVERRINELSDIFSTTNVLLGVLVAVNVISIVVRLNREKK